MKLTFKSSLNYLDVVHNFVNELSILLKFEAQQKIRLSIAVSEAVTNAIIHGNKENQDGTIIVNVDIKHHQLQIDVTDEGKNDFRYDPKRHGVLDENNVGMETGRGIFIMRSYLDQLKFRRIKNSGTCVSLIKYLDKEGIVCGHQN